MGERHIKHIRESGEWKEAVQGCLAADSFADACVGHVLDALEKSRYRDNTIVVLWGDHGYDVGEKKIGKLALWEQTTRTPLIIYAPGKFTVRTSTARGQRSARVRSVSSTSIQRCWSYAAYRKTNNSMDAASRRLSTTPAPIGRIQQSSRTRPTGSV